MFNKVMVCGLGAIGSNLLVGLARMFPDVEYTGLDFDVVEERNLRTQAYFVEHAKQKAPKAMAMRVVLARYVAQPKYTPLNRILDHPVSSLPECDLIIDCFDNSKSRALVTGENVLHLGFSPHLTAECIWDQEYSTPGDVDPGMPDICSQITALPFIHSFVNNALFHIADYAINGHKRGFIQNQINIRRL